MRGTIRQRLTISVVVVTTLMLAMLVLGFNLALRSSLDADANRLLEARAQAALESVDVEGERLDVNEGSDRGAPDALVWVYDGSRVVEQPQAAGKLDAKVNALIARGSKASEDNMSDTRLLAMPVKSGGKTVGTVVSGVSLEPYERTASRAAGASVILGLIMVILIAVTTRLVVGRALRPVSRMTAEAADWTEHDLDQRFNEGVPNDELTRLAATFDTMLDRMASMLRHERSFSAELSHELRTPLSAIVAETELALNRERKASEYRAALVRIAQQSNELNRVLETLLDVARAEGASPSNESADVKPAIAAALKPVQAVADRYGVQVLAEEDDPGLSVQVGLDTLKRILAPVLVNAVNFAVSSVSVSAFRGERQILILVADDGPGVAPEEAEEIFEPGRSGRAVRNPEAPPGTGLGLPLSRRLARANGGDVTVTVSPPAPGGLVTVTLPEAVPASL